jgi:predicted permease
VLAAIGGAAALLAAYWGAGALRTVLLPGFDWSSPPIDGRVFAATSAVTLGTGLLTGLVPALQASRPDLVGALKLGERSGGSTTHSRTRAALLVAQTTLCVVLLVAAGLFVRSLHNLRTADLGLDADRALAATVELSAVPGYTRDRIAAFFDDAAAAVRTLPDVERVSLATAYPFAFGMYGGTLELPGRPADSLARLSRGVPYEFDVTPGYFATLGVPLRRGRDFTDADRAGAPRVLIVNEALARLYWPGEDPVGRCARIAGHGPECAEVVGVVASSHLRRVREEEPSLAYFVPLAQSLDSYTGATRALLVRPRAGADPAVVAGHVRKRMQSLARDLPFVSVGSLGGRVAFELEPARLGATLFTLFGALALAVAAVGLYGVVSFGVAQRTREFGVRLALGATGGRVVRLVLREGVRYAAIGIALGLAAALAGGRLLAPFLYGVSPHELSVLGSVSAVLLAVAVVACTLPAWRATRVDPASALRSE